MLRVRRIPSRFGSLATCVAEFMSLDDAQRSLAHITIPGCLSLNGTAATRKLHADTIRILAVQIAATGLKRAHR